MQFPVAVKRNMLFPLPGAGGGLTEKVQSQANKNLCAFVSREMEPESSLLWLPWLRILWAADQRFPRRAHRSPYKPSIGQSQNLQSHTTIAQIWEHFTNLQSHKQMAVLITRIHFLPFFFRRVEEKEIWREGRRTHVEI